MAAISVKGSMLTMTMLLMPMTVLLIMMLTTMVVVIPMMMTMTTIKLGYSAPDSVSRC